jgi:hypothetical protein
LALELGWHPDEVAERFTLEEMREFIAIRTIEYEDFRSARNKGAED